jgi:hypothetical protein
MKHRNSHLLVGYWSRLRKGRPIPDQSDIDPRALKRMLPDMLILDAIEPSRPLYRLAGTQLCERHGSELRGTNFLAGWEVRSRRELSALLAQALKTHQPLCLSSFGTSPQASVVEMETLLAPVSFGGGDATRFVGMVQILGDGAQLADKPIAFQRLTDAQLVQEDEPLCVMEPPQRRPVLHLPEISGPARAPHLRLVVDHIPAPLSSQDLEPVNDSESDMERLVRVLYGNRTQPGNGLQS